MLSYVVQPSLLSGSLCVPASKSQSLRALLFSHFAKATILNLLDSPDVTAAKTCLKQLGTGGTLDVGNSGILLRFLAGIASLDGHAYTLTGDQSVLARPMQDLLQALRQLGVKSNGLTIQGPFRGGTAVLSGHDSQPVSALLIAAAFAPQPTELFVTHPGEIPWVQLTLSWFDRLGITYWHDNYRHYKVAGSSQISPFHYAVPSDLSSLAFPLAAAIATHSELTIRNIDLNEPQGDKQIVDILKNMGACLEYKEQALTIKPAFLHGIEVDINACIDTIAALAVIACFASGKTRIKNARVAREKECDRIQALTSELKKMGARIEEHSDGLTIYSSSLKGANVESYKDHRMAMSLAVAGLGATGITRIRDVACVDKTFPNFHQTLSLVGALIEVAS